MRIIDSTSIVTLLFSLAILAVGYAAFGFWTTMIFTVGFLGGWIAWMVVPSNGEWSDIRVPYFVTLILFLGHRVEERVMGFFAALQAITGVETPEILSWEVILLVFTSVGAWLLVPVLVARRNAVGVYLAWTFFVSMGVTELAHFLVVGGPYRYFPGMLSVALLAPAAWWGMVRLAHGRLREPLHIT